jgi:hypothetical protein
VPGCRSERRPCRGQLWGSQGPNSDVPGSNKRVGLGRYGDEEEICAGRGKRRGRDRQHGLLLPCITNLGFLLLPSGTEQGVTQGLSGELGGVAGVK